MKDLFLLDKNRSAIFKEYKIYVDVSVDENSDFQVSQKLTSFFGQIGVYEGHDRIINYFDWMFKINNIRFFSFKENFDFESFDVNLEEYSNEEVIFGFENNHNKNLKKFSFNKHDDIINDDDDISNNFKENNYEEEEENGYESEYEHKFETYNNGEDEYKGNDNNNNNDDENEYEDNEKKLKMFVPINIFFYFGEKKVNFFLLNSFKKKYYYDRRKYINSLNYIKFKEEFYAFKDVFFNKIKNYIQILSLIITFFKSNNFYLLLNLTSLDFFKNDNFLKLFLKQFIESYNLKRSKIFIFKKILNKKFFFLTFNLKKMKWFDNELTLSLFFYKYCWFNNKFKHIDLFNSQVYFMSQLNSIKKKYLKKFKRRRRYKKRIIRDFFGKKNVYEKVYNIVEEKKKKKRR